VIYRGLDFAVARGETVTILGASGSGKSVMLKMLIGLLDPDKGEILFDGQDVASMDDAGLYDVRRRIAYLFQGAALFDSLSVYENLAYGLREHLRLPEDQIAERVAKSLADVGLPGIEKTMPADLSGGMRKRVGIARAVAVRPEVLLYDEPTTGLDPISTEVINHLISETRTLYSVTSVVVTHDMASAFQISDRIAMIHKGFVIFQGTPDEIRKSDDPRVIDFIEGNAPEDDNVETLLRYGG